MTVPFDRRPLHRTLVPGLLVSVLALSACGGGDDTSSTNANANAGYGGATSADQRQGGRANMELLQACLKQQGVELPERAAPNRAGGDEPSTSDGAAAPPDGNGPPEGGLPGGGAPPNGGEGGAQGGPFAELSDEDREKLQKAMEECGGGRGGPGGERPDVDSAAYRTSITAYVACVRENGFDLPDPDFSGDGPIFDPKEVDQQDATFKKASAACQSALRSQGTRRSEG